MVSKVTQESEQAGTEAGAGTGSPSAERVNFQTEVRPKDPTAPANGRPAIEVRNVSLWYG